MRAHTRPTSKQHYHNPKERASRSRHLTVMFTLSNKFNSLQMLKKRKRKIASIMLIFFKHSAFQSLVGSVTLGKAQGIR